MPSKSVTVDRREQRAGLCDPRTLVRHIWGTFGLVVSNFTLASFGALSENGLLCGNGS